LLLVLLLLQSVVVLFLSNFYHDIDHNVTLVQNFVQFRPRNLVFFIEKQITGDYTVDQYATIDTWLHRS